MGRDVKGVYLKALRGVCSLGRKHTFLGMLQSSLSNNRCFQGKAGAAVIDLSHIRSQNCAAKPCPPNHETDVPGQDIFESSQVL